MTDRDRLIELIKNAPTTDTVYGGIKLKQPAQTVQTIADHLLENGVIVLPCEKGDVLIRNGEKCVANHWNIILTAFNESGDVRLFDVEEAEQKLKELNKDA